MITVNIEKAKLIAHELRRHKRQEELDPLDNLITKQIPGKDFTVVEQERQKIRDKYAVIQEKIDAAKTIKQIKTILNL